jgi:hypothetical protein
MNEAFTTHSRVPAPVNFLLGLVGAAVGGFLGYLAFLWLLKQGYYAVALPGVVLGLFAGLIAPRRSWPLAIFCGVSALGLGLFAEWKNLPFTANSSLDYFLKHLGDLKSVTHVMLAVGTLAGFWFALGKKAA